MQLAHRKELPTLSTPLSQLTQTELRHFFPIILTPHNPAWNTWYQIEVARIKQYLEAASISLNYITIHHIGSTSIPTIWAKPTVDILLEIPKTLDMTTLKTVITANGYVCMHEDKEKEQISFNCGYTPEGFAQKVFHLHLRYDGDNDELYFRDYMITHPHIAKQYEELKLSLWKLYEYNRDAYTDSKTPFIKKYTEAAKQEYKDRYSRT